MLENQELLFGLGEPKKIVFTFGYLKRVKQPKLTDHSILVEAFIFFPFKIIPSLFITSYYT